MLASSTFASTLMLFITASVSFFVACTRAPGVAAC